MISPHSFEVGTYRPPSEGGASSLLLRFTRNCPWNKCTFCGMYKHETFSKRSVEEIKSDMDAIKRLCRDLQDISTQLGYQVAINREVIFKIIEQNPQLDASPEFVMVVNWLLSGAKTAFLQDGNSLIMATPHLVEALQYLRTAFPSIERVTTYARSKTLSRKPLEELTRIRKAGVDRLHVGMESGDDDLLKQVKKGVTGKEHIIGGKKAIQAGFQLSEYWMPGLGGKDMWENHARNTAGVLSEINPHYIRSRPFFPRPGSPIYKSYEQEALSLLTPLEQLYELRLMVEGLDVTSKLCFDHAGNYWTDKEGRLLFTHSYEGYQMPHEKSRVLGIIDKGIWAYGG